jgi:serine/threonine protein kinase
VRDYIFLKHIEELDISPKVEFLSLPIKFTVDPNTDKTDFKMMEEERNECAADPESSLRFMVMQAADMSVETCVRRLENRGITVTMRQAVNFMKATIEAIWKLHSKNIVHGDIHFGNIVFMPAESEGGSRRVGLIDFGTASFLSELELLEDLTREPFTYNHCFQSHWNIAGYRFSFRDDIFKAILAGAMYLNGSDFVRFCQAADIDTMYEFKSEGFLFNFPDHPDAIEPISASDSARESIRTHLSNVLRLIRGVESLDARPPYREILDQLDQVLTFL